MISPSTAVRDRAVSLPRASGHSCKYCAHTPPNTKTNGGGGVGQANKKSTRLVVFRARGRHIRRVTPRVRVRVRNQEIPISV